MIVANNKVGVCPCVVCGASTYNEESIPIVPKNDDFYFFPKIDSKWVKDALRVHLCNGCILNIKQKDYFKVFVRKTNWKKLEVDTFADILSNPLEYQFDELELNLADHDLMTQISNDNNGYYEMSEDERLTYCSPNFKVKISNKNQMRKDYETMLFNAIRAYSKVIRAIRVNTLKKIEEDVLSFTMLAFENEVEYLNARTNGRFTQVSLSKVLKVPISRVRVICKNNPDSLLFSNFANTSRKVLELYNY